MRSRGYFGIGVYGMKTHENYGTLFRSANIFGASFLCMVNSRFVRQSSDTMRSERHLPLYEYTDIASFLSNRPRDCQLIGVEITDTAVGVSTFTHPERALYILGPEDGSIPTEILDKCQHVVKLPGTHCLNVSVAGSIILYDRVCKNG